MESMEKSEMRKLLSQYLFSYVACYVGPPYSGSPGLGLSDEQSAVGTVRKVVTKFSSKAAD